MRETDAVVVHSTSCLGRQKVCKAACQIEMKVPVSKLSLTPSFDQCIAFHAANQLLWYDILPD